MTPAELRLLALSDAAMNGHGTGRPITSTHRRAAYWRLWKRLEYQRRSVELRERRRKRYHEEKARAALHLAHQPKE